MSVATKNPFALLEEDASRSSSPVPAPAPAAAPAAPAPARGNAQKSRGGPAARGGKYYARGGAKSAVRAEDLSGQGNLNPNGIEDPPAADKRFDGRGRGRGGSRGTRGGRGRQFDKHSQTGKVDTEKRVNQGWGADEGGAELKAEQGAVKDANAEAAAPAGEWGAPAADAGDWSSPAAGAADWNGPAAGAADDAAPAATADGTNAERDSRPRREREPEEEDNTLTLDQYLAQQKEKESSVVPKLEGIRKANEGADGNIWKDAVALEKSEEDTYFAGKSRAAPKVRAKKEEKVFLEIEARFERPRGGGRGGRGGDERGGRGRGGRGNDRGRAAAPRGGRSAASAPVEISDERAFPSLS